MSVFSFPRLHVKGLLAINVGTGNNDDYSNVLYQGQPLRLADSIFVQPVDFGMDDATFVKWAQIRQEITTPAPGKAPASFLNKGPGDASQQYRIPGEWNYYGDMGLTMRDVKVIGVQTGANKFDPGHPFMGSQLSFNNRPGPTGGSTGMLIDVNPEGVPCSQVFADFLTLTGNDGNAVFTGKPGKAVTRWINFQRNARLKGPNGAAGYFHCVVPIKELQGQPIVQFMSPSGSPPPAGIVFRYYMFRSLQPINVFKYTDPEWLDQMEALYAKGQSGQSNYPDYINPTYVQLSGTIAPWYAGEMQSVATGRLLYPGPGTKTIPVPPPPSGESGGNGSQFSLAPALLQVGASLQSLSVDFIASFPDQYQKNTQDPYNPLQTNNNPKMDFGSVSLKFRVAGKDKFSAAIPYTNTGQGDMQGWLFDLPMSGITRDDLQQGSFVLTSDKLGDLLIENDFYIASDQSNIFGEQNGSPNSFMNEGLPEGPSTIRVFQKGQELTAANCPPITVWQYAVVPNQKDFNATRAMTNYKPGLPLQVDNSQPGVFLFTFNFNSNTPPYADSQSLDLMNAPMINLRMLPNNKDYSQYYKDPKSPEPVGNDKLTFQVIYQEVLRNYYLLYPGMNAVIPLNDPQQWEDAEMARRLYQHTQKSWWNQYGYMPRTRDLSQTRRTLLHAWARKYLQQ